MSQVLVCKQGHQWEVRISQDSPMWVCPSCGSTPETSAVSMAERLDELPPPPLSARPQKADGVTLHTDHPTTLAEKPQRIGDYEILAELGRGGMGVVYRAHQISLNRIVALKMILAGEYASPELHSRFRNEAETVARLQHPNIVQVHEVGEKDGRPFFSLEYIDGGSLAQKLAAGPLPPKEAAALLRTLAVAMQYAHERSVIHRDLKPANVLLTTDGSPKIADFGLARLLDDDRGQTKSGAMLGTPSYMAPEQTRGEIRKIGPATDVYALGAVLYECLTGRPPFQAASALETARQVLNLEPIPLSRLQPGLPRDLETICLKCLQKDPARRYPTATALADDLDRFLKGEPVRARPVGWPERAARWCRRNPKLASLLAALVLVFAAGFVGVTWQWRRATKERDEAEKNYRMARQVVIDYFASLGSDPALDPVQALPLRQDMLATALTHFQKLLRERGDDAELQTHLARAHYCLGRIRATTGMYADAFANRAESRASYETARADYGEARAIQEQVLATQRDDVQLQRNLAATYHALARTESDLALFETDLAQLDRAHHAHQLAIAIRERLRDANPADADLRRDLAESYGGLGWTYHKGGKSGEGLPFFLQARGILEQVIGEHPDDVNYLCDLVTVLNSLGLALYVLERWEEALLVFQEAIQRQQPVLVNARHALKNRHLASVSHFNMAKVLIKLNRHADAADAARLCRLYNSENPAYLLYAARMLALASDELGKREEKLSAREEKAREQYAQEAVQILREAIRYGLKDFRKTLDWAELRPLRDRADIKQLLAEIEGQPPGTP